MLDLTTALNQITGRGPGERLTLEARPATRTVLVAGGTVLVEETADEHYRRCFRFAHDAVKALRLSTNAHIPNLSIERVWPSYFIVGENEPGKLEVSKLMLVAHGFANGVPATDEQLREASTILLAGWHESPVELYRDFKLGAQNAARVDGDYIDAVLKAAVAAEVLIKNTAWMLIWEASKEQPDASDPSVFTVKPRKLIGSVLCSRLKGDWSAQDEKRPIGAWRILIAQRRSAILHKGYRPNEREVWQTIQALQQFEQHLLDRLAVMAHTYPHTAALLVGRPGLERRNAWKNIQSPPEDARALADLTRSYVKWRNCHLGEDAPD